MKTKSLRRCVLTVKLTQEDRRLAEQLAGRLTIKTGRRHTMTDVVELALRRLSEDEPSGEKQ